MGQFNEFLASIECPNCGATAKQSSEALLKRVGVAATPDTALRFQARAGVLSHHAFKVGDRVITETSASGPAEPVEVRPGQDYWVTGVATCGRCGIRIWAHIEVKQGLFARLSVVDEPADVLSWDLIDPG